MDEKVALDGYYSRPLPTQGMIRPPKARAPHRLLFSCLLSAGLCYLLWLKTDILTNPPMALLWRNNHAYTQQQAPIVVPEVMHLMSENATRVPLEAHIMSKCPDARDCLRDLVVPAMEKVEDLVDFRLSFIGEYVSLCRYSRSGVC
jgi:hypothetical protein